jgi:hypothetical protein
VVSSEAELLGERGHRVTEYRWHNDELGRQRPGLVAIMSAGIAALWASDSQRAVEEIPFSSLLFRPDVVSPDFSQGRLFEIFGVESENSLSGARFAAARAVPSDICSGAFRRVVLLM